MATTADNCCLYSALCASQYAHLALSKSLARPLFFAAHARARRAHLMRVHVESTIAVAIAKKESRQVN